jgi:hypothetical protein
MNSCTVTSPPAREAPGNATLALAVFSSPVGREECSSLNVKRSSAPSMISCPKSFSSAISFADARMRTSSPSCWDAYGASELGRTRKKPAVLDGRHPHYTVKTSSRRELQCAETCFDGQRTGLGYRDCIDPAPGGDLKTTQEWLGHSNSPITADVLRSGAKRSAAKSRRGAQPGEPEAPVREPANWGSSTQKSTFLSTKSCTGNIECGPNC